MVIIASTLARIKSDPMELLGGDEWVNQCFCSAGHVWRDRVLNPARTMALFIQQIAHGNTAISHLRILSRIGCAPSSYCDARERLPLAGVAAMVEHLSGNKPGVDPDSSWLNRRVVMADATTVTTPDEPALQELWPQPCGQKPGCGFPMGKLLMLVNLATGMIQQMTMMALNVHEASQIPGLHLALRAKDVLLGDTAFCSFGHLALLAKLSVDAVFRMSRSHAVDFTPNRPCRRNSRKKKKDKQTRPLSHFVGKLGEQDQIVRWIRPPRKPAWMDLAQWAALPGELMIRELRYQITDKGMRSREVTIATTLLDPMRYPKREIARLYKLRWEIETNFRHLKTTMRMEHLKCKTPDGVMKELMVFALVYNVVRAAMTLAAARQGIADANRISFIDTLRWIMIPLTAPASGTMPKLIVNPLRPGRYHPRVIKRRRKLYPALSKPRRAYPQPGMDEVIIN